jgi:phosphoglucomutase
VRDLTTGYDSTTDDNKAVFPSDPGSQMITFTFDNGVIATLRTSGTEPKLKYYAEYCGLPEETDWSRIETELESLVQYLTHEFVQVEENGLLSQTMGEQIMNLIMIYFKRRRITRNSI